MGIPGGLFNGFETFEEAQEAYMAAQTDGVVMMLTMRDPIPSRFFEF